MGAVHVVRRAGATLVVLAALARAAPTPREAWATLCAPMPVDPSRPVVAAVTLLADVLLAWLALTALLTAGSRLRGPVGTLSGAAARCVAPAVVRRAVALSLGLGVALGTAGAASAATPEGHTLGARAGAVTAAAGLLAPLDWPLAAAGPLAGGTSPTGGASGPTAGPAAGGSPGGGAGTTSGTTPGAATGSPTPAPTGTAGAPADIVVQTGDTLWGLAARSLPPGAPVAAVAARWPAWWAANRDVIGDDPGLLHPGQHLRPPAS